MITHDLGENHFWGVDKAYAVPLWFNTTVHENDPPYRVSRATGIHFFPGKALLFGRWGRPSGNMTEHLMQALRGRIVTFENTPKVA